MSIWRKFGPAGCCAARYLTHEQGAGHAALVPNRLQGCTIGKAIAGPILPYKFRRMRRHVRAAPPDPATPHCHASSAVLRPYLGVCRSPCRRDRRADCRVSVELVCGTTWTQADTSLALSRGVSTCDCEAGPVPIGRQIAAHC